MYSLKLIIIISSYSYIIHKVSTENTPLDSCHENAGYQNLIGALNQCGTLARFDMTQQTTSFPESIYNELKAQSISQIWMMVIDENQRWTYNFMNLTSTFDEDQSNVINASTTSGTSLSNYEDYNDIYITAICYTCDSSLPTCTAPQIIHERQCYWITDTQEDFDHSDMSCALSHGILAPITSIQTHRILSILQTPTEKPKMWFGLSKNTTSSEWIWSNMTKANLDNYNAFQTISRRKRDDSDFTLFPFLFTLTWWTTTSLTATTTTPFQSTITSSTKANQPSSPSNQGSPPSSTSPDQGSPQPSSSITQGSPPSSTSPNQGSPQPSSSTTQGSNHGSPQPSSSSNQGSPQPSSSPNQGSPQPSSSSNPGSPQPSSSTNQGSPQPPTIPFPSNTTPSTNVSQLPSITTTPSESEETETDLTALCAANYMQFPYEWILQPCSSTFIGICMAYASPCNKSTQYYYKGQCYSCSNSDGTCAGSQTIQINADDPLAKLYTSVCCLLGIVCTGTYPQNMCGNNF